MAISPVVYSRPFRSRQGRYERPRVFDDPPHPIVRLAAPLRRRIGP